MNTTILASLVLSVPLFSSASQSRPAPAQSTIPESPALLFFGDVDGDRLEDAFSVSLTGEAKLLHNDGNGQFEDITLASGLADLTGVTFGLFADFDGDHTLDLYVGGVGDVPRVYRNYGNASFEPLPLGKGVQHLATDLSARAVDLDGDGALDLHVHTDMGDVVYRNTSHGFERMALGSLMAPVSLSGGAVVHPADASEQGGVLPNSNGRSRDAGSLSGPDGLGGTSASGWGRFGPTRNDPDDLPATIGTLTAVPIGCVTTLRDQGNPGPCIPASTTPGVIGRLYPLSANLFVAVSGNVGIGTTSPTARLHVAGTARITDTLTLNPAGDQALNVSTGSIYKGGSLFIHTYGGSGNTALGQSALQSVTIGGTHNTANGRDALRFNITGDHNTASGYEALRSNTASYNTAIGSGALKSNTSGTWNTASGARALHLNTTGLNNTANGYQALRSNLTGSGNTASGAEALYSNTTGSGNTASGRYALRLNTIGARNTASGSAALTGNTSGSYNTASGCDALQLNSTGTNNTASGYRALRNNSTGNNNTASGVEALFSNTTAPENTATGWQTLRANTTGDANTATGVQALLANTTGFRNTASGSQALAANTTGVRNTATGAHALFSNTTGGYNTATGAYALNSNTTGFLNIALGQNAGANLTTGSSNIAIGNAGVAGEGATIRVGTAGTHARSFIAGIRGVTTGVADAIPVLVDSAGQLGTVSSSRRFKKDIADMGELSDRLLELRPVVFHYKQEQQLPNHAEVPLEYGLIAEEVAEHFPDLVVYDEEGKPFTVKYHLLSSMLLNEMKKQEARLEMQNDEHVREMEELRTRLAALESRASPAPTPAAPSAGSR